MITCGREQVTGVCGPSDLGVDQRCFSSLWTVKKRAHSFEFGGKTAHMCSN